MHRSTKLLHKIIPAAVIGCLAGLTGIAALVVATEANHAAATQHAALANRVQAEVVHTVDSSMNRVQDIAAAVTEHWPARASEFNALASGLLDDPAINGVALVQRVDAGQRGLFERTHGAIRSLQRASAVPAEARQAYFVVRAGVQRRRPLSSLGVDLGAEPVRMNTMLAAARSGHAQASQPVRRIDAGGFATALYVPVYRSGRDLHTSAQRLAALRGFVASGYRYGVLERALLGTLPPGTAFSLSDSHAKLLSVGAITAPDVAKIAVAGRVWTLAVGAPSADRSLLLTTLLVGLVATILGGALSVQLARRERYALDMVDKRISEREVAERGRAQAEERFRTTFAQAPIGMAVADLDGSFLQVNRALSRLTGYDPQKLLGMGFLELTHPEDRAAEARGLEAMRTGRLRVYNAERRYLHAAGHPIWVAVHCAMIYDEAGEPTHFLVQTEDVTSRRDYESELKHMADHDPLTGLLNRRAFERILEEHVVRGERYGHTGAVMVLDLDQFKQVNDTLGHSAGDELIMRVAKALATTLRKSDATARLGGDEFAVLLPAGNVKDAQRVADKLLRAIAAERSATSDGAQATLTASIGIAPLSESVELTSRRGPDQCRPGHVRRQGGWAQPQHCLRRIDARPGPCRGAAGLDQADPAGDRRRRAHLVCPAGLGADQRTGSATRAARPYARCRRRPDHARELPAPRGALRADQSDRQVGDHKHDRAPRRALRHRQATHGRDQPLRPLARRLGAG